MLLGAGGLASLLLLALWLFCIFDVIGTDEAACRNLPKTVWLLLVLILPAIGGVAWLIMGRPPNTTFTPGSSAYRPAPRGVDGPIAHQDPLASDHLSSIVRDREERARLHMLEEQLKRREQELLAREEELRRREDG